MIALLLAALLFLSPLPTPEVEIQITDVHSTKTGDVVTLDTDATWVVKRLSNLKSGKATMGTYVYTSIISCTVKNRKSVCTRLPKSCYAIKQNDIVACIR